MVGERVTQYDDADQATDFFSEKLTLDIYSLLLPIMRGRGPRFSFGPGVGVSRGAGGKECVEMSIE